MERAWYQLSFVVLGFVALVVGLVAHIIPVIVLAAFAIVYGGARAFWKASRG